MLMLSQCFNPSQVGSKLYYLPTTKRKDYVSIPHRQAQNIQRYGMEKFKLMRFQSLIGRLKTFAISPAPCPTGEVSIPHRQAQNVKKMQKLDPIFSRGFNPSQVGSKPGSKANRDTSRVQFQSLIGRLKTKAVPHKCHYYQEFQSLIGRLKTWF